jgi:uncharacterized membrane-anchored protein YjiN (DUF445 family)
MSANKYKATCILGIVSCGFLASYPFSHTFFGGLLARGFGAAMIGGLADWFAVSALFRRPLGIPFRTAIIPRNREKIFQALIDMVEHEILIKENIKKNLDDYDLTATLLYFINENSGKQDVKKMLYRFWQDFALQVNPEDLEVLIQDFVEDNMDNIKVLPYGIPIVQWFMDHEYDDKILDLIIEQCFIAAQNEKFVHLLANVFAAVTKKYEHGMNRRKLFNLLMDLSPKQLARAAQHGLVSILLEMKSPQHPFRLDGKAKLKQFVVRLQNDADFGQRVESWLQQNIIYKFKLGEKISGSMVAVFHKVIRDNRMAVRGMDSLMAQLEIVLEDFAENQEDRVKMDLYLKAVLGEWLDRNHDQIGRIVKESLNEFTNERLVNFIDGKMGNDLQMIRINGSFVGGLVGMILYILTYWL